ncbi:DUF1330 domain-containing protein [Sandarakinorhabdus rubra]|uniref:DUF1330 domain-containing protein n=1 Tax=Sandarakinorhabdus rubra TaxID=2672568 RepID=UPI0013DB9F61|nr:DUF1330 domain-containing protein [Sandarakinorhabdus rubra]
MSHYLIANYRITDQEGYQRYLELVGATTAAHGAEVLVADFDSQIVEGGGRPVSVVVRFASREAALGWYNSPEYRAVVHHRQNNTEGFVLFANGAEPA